MFRSLETVTQSQVRSQSDGYGTAGKRRGRLFPYCPSAKSSVYIANTIILSDWHISTQRWSAMANTIDIKRLCGRPTPYIMYFAVAIIGLVTGHPFSVAIGPAIIHVMGGATDVPPVAPPFPPTAPAYQPTYLPTAHAYQPTYLPTAPAYQPTYLPTAHAYQPTYLPTAHAYQPTYPPSGPTYRPMLPPTAPVYPPTYPPMHPILPRTYSPTGCPCPPLYTTFCI